MTSHFIGKVSVRAIIEKDGKVLVTRDEKDNMWEIPGGRIDKGEGLADGLCREIREELGVDVIVGGFVHSGQFLHIRDNVMQLVVTFVCTLADPTAMLTANRREVAEVRWINVAEMHELAFIHESKEALLAYWADQK